jgi:hypothetical protein
VKPLLLEELVLVLDVLMLAIHKGYEGFGPALQDAAIIALNLLR